MDWQDVIDEGFPKPSDEEPESLRRDIEDELTDHLESAFVRETRVDGDETDARRRVLDRFGDPKRIARRLWFDAMKEKIMGQRVLLGAVGILAVTSVVTSALLWTSLRETRTVNAAILESLQRRPEPIAQPSPGPDPMQWSELTVRCALDSDERRPAKGMKVFLRGEAINPSKEITLEKITDAEGIARFESIRTGSYKYWVDTSWDYGSDSFDIMLFPATVGAVDVACPTQPPDAQVRFEPVWPGDAADKVILTCEIWPKLPMVSSDGHEWTYLTPRMRTVALRNDGSIVLGTEFRQGNHPRDSWRYAMRQGNDGGRSMWCRTGGGYGYVDALIDTVGVPMRMEDHLALQEGTYQVRRIAVYLPDKKETEDKQPLRELGLYAFDQGGLHRTGGHRIGPVFKALGAERLAVARKYRGGGHEPIADLLPAVTYEARAGKTNVWRIPIPEKFWRSVMERLAKIQEETDASTANGAND